MTLNLMTVDPSSPTLEELAEKVFYGVKLDSKTGGASIDKIVGDEPIRLPDPSVHRHDDYVSMMWTKNTLQFDWDATTGRLLMEVL
jgi:hypothetical protein